MRQLQSFGILVLSLIFVSSCGEDLSGPPTITLTPNSGNVDIGETITTAVDIDTPTGFGSVTITTIVDGVRDDANSKGRIAQVPGQDGLGFPYEFTETTRMMATASVVDVEFLAIDKEGQTTIALFRVEVNAPSILNVPESSLTPPQLDANGGSTSTTFFSTSSEQSSWTVNQVNAEADDFSGEIDFGFYYNTATNSATLASIFDFPIVNFAGIDIWSMRNNTLFKRTDLTTAEFDAAGFVAIYNAFENGIEGDRAERVTDLAMDDIIAFETDESKDDGIKRGLIRVHSIQAGDGSNDFIRVSVIFED